VVERRLPEADGDARQGRALDVESRIIIATPRFSSPMRSAAETRIASKRSSAVGLPRIPIFSSLRLHSNPGVFPSTRNTEMPCAPSAAGPVRAYTTSVSASEPLVMNVFPPSST